MLKNQMEKMLANKNEQFGIKSAWTQSSAEQPLKLYHSTLNSDLTTLEPRQCKAMNGEKGNFVFATDDLSRSYAYALKNEDMLCMHYMSGFPDRSVHACIIKDREKFLRLGGSGAIYEVPPAQFRRIYFENGVASREWVSDAPVKLDPDKKIKVTLEDAIESGVQIFFASPDADESLAKDVYDPEGIKDWEESNYYRAWKRGDLTWENYDRGASPFPAENKPSADQITKRSL